MWRSKSRWFGSCLAGRELPCVLGTRWVSGADGDGAADQPREPTPLQDAATLTLRGPTPDAMVDAIRQGVLEARLLDRAVSTDPPRDLYTHAIAGKERRRRLVGTSATGHPLGIHRSSVAEVDLSTVGKPV